MVRGERFVLKNKFDGLPKETDFELIKDDLGPLEDGDIYFQAEYISVDPYQRAYVTRMKTPMTMIGSSVAKVLESKDPSYPVGSQIVCYAGWVKLGKMNPAKENAMAKGALPRVRIAPDIGNLPPSLLLGACGMPGCTAYFGLLELCQPKEGETVLVNGAAGAVGSIVGQIARIKGCQVMGFAGSDAKCNYLKEELGFDYAFNYKKTEALKCVRKAQKGIDCFFDNVGGPDSTTVLNHMNHRGRIAVCGSISTYNDKEPTMAPVVQGPLVFKELKMEGFLVHRWVDRFDEGVHQLAKWIQAGRIKTRETVVDGFEKTPEAFIGLFKGDNLGKMIIKV